MKSNIQVVGNISHEFEENILNNTALQELVDRFVKAFIPLPKTPFVITINKDQPTTVTEIGQTTPAIVIGCYHSDLPEYFFTNFVGVKHHSNWIIEMVAAIVSMTTKGGCWFSQQPHYFICKTEEMDEDECRVKTKSIHTTLLEQDVFSQLHFAGHSLMKRIEGDFLENVYYEKTIFSTTEAIRYTSVKFKLINSSFSEIRKNIKDFNKELFRAFRIANTRCLNGFSIRLTQSEDNVLTLSESADYNSLNIHLFNQRALRDLQNDKYRHMRIGFDVPLL